MVNSVVTLERLDKAHELKRSPNLERFPAVLETEQKTKILSSHQKQKLKKTYLVISSFLPMWSKHCVLLAQKPAFLDSF